jgi:hypothetical protein
MCAQLVRYAGRLILLLIAIWLAGCTTVTPAPTATASEGLAVTAQGSLPMPTVTMPSRLRDAPAGRGTPAPPLLDPGSPPEPYPVAATATITPADTLVQPARPFRGLWLSQEGLAHLPMDGPAWEQLLTVASAPLPEPEIGDQNDMSDVMLLARALVYARTGDSELRDEVVTGLQRAMDSLGRPNRTGILAIARNVPPYVIAADLINLPADERMDSAFRSWLQELRDTTFSGNSGAYSLITCHESRPNNFGTHCGAARIAIDLYLSDDADLERAATVFEGWLGNRNAYDGFVYGRLSWQADPKRPVGINPPDAVIDGHSVGGALPEEMRRAGQFAWPPKETQYAWEALQGAVVQAELLQRAGYPAWQWQQQALLRAARFLYEIGWEAEGDDEWQVWLLNAAYGTDFPAHSPARPGKNMGWTDWTHGSPQIERAHDSTGAADKEDTDG